MVLNEERAVRDKGPLRPERTRGLSGEKTFHELESILE